MSKNDSKTWRPSTWAVKKEIQRTYVRETGIPIFLTSGFVYDSPQMAEEVFAEECTEYGGDAYIYSRYGNPNLTHLEERLGAMHGHRGARVFSSGMAAIQAMFFALLRPGSRVVASRVLFGSTQFLLEGHYAEMGVSTTFVSGSHLDDWAQALNQKTDLVVLESPSNPILEVLDLQAISELAHKVGATVLLDNTFASMVVQDPFAFGVDVAMYSLTKHVDGHGRAIGGALVAQEQFLIDHIKAVIRHTGPSLSPMHAWYFSHGLESLAVRVAAMSATALELARRLETMESVERISYPGLTSHPQYDIAKKQMKCGGSMIGVYMRGGKEAAYRVLSKLELILISNNLGDSRTLAIHPFTTTHHTMKPEIKNGCGITESFLRFSIGLEDVEDLWDDMHQAFSTV